MLNSLHALVNAPKNKAKIQAVKQCFSLVVYLAQLKGTQQCFELRFF